jgi:hypothetical protein
MAEPKFEHCWLYGPNREAVELFTQADYDHFAAMGWKGSPADFGIETHPQHPVQSVAVTSVADPLTSAPALTQLQTQVTQVEGEVVSVQGLLESVMNRLGVLEDLFTQMTTPAPPPVAPEREARSEASTAHDDASRSSGRSGQRRND